MPHHLHRPLKTFPLERRYYYQDGSTTRLIQTDPLQVERTPTATGMRSQQAPWSLDTWSSHIHWPLTLDAWTLEDAARDPQTGLPILPDTWTTLPFELAYGAFAFASPYGHLFSLPDSRRYLSPHPILLPHSSPAPRHDDTTNMLRAVLGDTFYCYRCMHRHRPDSASLHHCQTSTPTGRDQPAGQPKTEYFSAQTHYLDDRVQWYTHHHRLSHEMDTAWKELTTWLTTQTLDMTVPLITPAELAAAGGLHTYHLRVQDWHQTIRAEYLRRDETITDRCQALESVLPTPSPIGPPCRTKFLAPPISACLTPQTLGEITRIQTALAPFPSTITYGTGGLTLTFTRPRDTKTTPRTRPNDLVFWHALQEAFAIRISSVTCHMQTNLRSLNTVDVLGLDPHFWCRVAFTPQKLLFSTHTLHYSAT